MNYPSLLRRYVASMIDFIVVITLIYWSAKLLPNHGGDENSAGVLCFFVAIMYEPLLTAYGCTLGQLAMRFRVRVADSNERASLPRIYLRVFIKYVLGIVSFLTLPARRDRRAIHDLVAGTIVVGSEQSAKNQ